MASNATQGAGGRRFWATVAAAVALLGLGVGWMGWSAWRSADLRGRARAAVVEDDWARASDLLGRLAWYDPHDPEVRGLRVRAAMARGVPDEAARLLAEVPERAPDAVEARLTRGRLLVEAFRIREAEAAFRDCLRIEPDADAARLPLIAILAVQRRAREYDAEAWALYERGGEPIKALRLLAEAAPSIPPDTLARTATEGDVLARCLEADPADPHTRVALARFERNRGDTAGALRLLEPALNDPAAGPAARVERIACLLDDGEDESLRPEFEPPVEALRDLPDYWLLRGEWARRMGRESEALESFREAVRLDPRQGDAHYRLGLALRESGLDAADEAARHLEVARKARALRAAVSRVRDDERDPERLAEVGRLCADLGRDREARAWLGLALRRDPSHAGARAALADLGGPADGRPRGR